jgi:hypothetical protein
MRTYSETWEDGTLRLQKHYDAHGQLHCTTGPAYIQFDRSGIPIFERYWLHGVGYNRSQWQIEICTTVERPYCKEN